MAMNIRKNRPAILSENLGFPEPRHGLGTFVIRGDPAIEINGKSADIDLVQQADSLVAQEHLPS